MMYLEYFVGKQGTNSPEFALPLVCTTFALEIAHKIHRALFMAAGCDKLNQQKVLDARCTIQGQVWISRLNPSMNSNSSIHSNCCANSSSSSLSCRLDRGCSIATGIIVEYASVRSPAVTSALQKSFHESSRYFVSTQSTVHCLHQNGSIIFPSSGSEVSKDCASYQQLFNKYVIQSWNIGWFLILITRWLFREIWYHFIWSDFILSDLISCHLISFYLIW